MIDLDGVPGGFQIVERSGQTEELVTQLPVFDRRTIVFVRPTDRSVVFGSMQEVSVEQRNRCEAEGFSTRRRRSGGGGIVIDPPSAVWIDLFLPKDDPLYLRDVRTGSFWVGDLWQQALSKLEPQKDSPLHVHRGAVVETMWSKQCCFLGVGPGEVMCQDHKIMGLSQRRDRTGAWFFSLVYRSIDIDRDAHLLAANVSDEGALADELARHVAAVSYSQGHLEGEVLRSLTQFG